MKDRYLTKDGLEKLREELEDLKIVKRREIAEAIHTAKEEGDLSENAEYVNAKEEQHRLEEKIAQIESVIKNAHVVSRAGKSKVTVGNMVLIVCDKKEIEYKIVGSDEANPLEGMISNESPVGRALMQRKKGERILIPTPVGEKECEIVDIK